MQGPLCRPPSKSVADIVPIVLVTRVGCSAGPLRIPDIQSGTVVLREVKVRDIETVLEWIRRPNEKNGIDRPSE